MDAWDDVLNRLNHATGHDRELDHAIAGVLETAGTDPEVGGTRAFTASVDDSRWAFGRLLPGWTCHIGYDARGMFPYAVVTDGHDRSEAAAPTVPLAVLRAAFRGYGASLARTAGAGRNTMTSG